MERSVSVQAAGLASLTLVHTLIEALLLKQVITADEVKSIFKQSIDLHENVAVHTTGEQNTDAAYLLRQIQDDILQMSS